MDIYSFIRSNDVAEYCRKIGKQWDTIEMAVIIDRSGRPMAERHAAWQELIDNYPDMPSPSMPCYVHETILYNELRPFDSIHEKLAEIIDSQREQVKSDPSEDNEHKFYGSVLRGYYVDIPTPYKKGDILTIKDGRIFVLDSLQHDVVRFKDTECFLGSFGGWGYFVGDDGMLYGDHVRDRDVIEYYHGKLEGNNRLYHYVNLYLNEEIGLVGILTMQCRILAEHQLNEVFPIDSHGCYIPEPLRSENRLTPDEKEQIEKTDGLYPWVVGKLSIHQVEFLAREFGGDNESVQKYQLSNGCSLLGSCAAIVHDENHFQKIGDAKYNPSRKAMARMILEAYGWTESGWVNVHEKKA